MEPRAHRARPHWTRALVALAASLGVAAVLATAPVASMAGSVAASLGCALIVGAGIMITLRLESPRLLADEFPAEPEDRDSQAAPQADSKARRGVLVGCCLASALLFAAISTLSGSASLPEARGVGPAVFAAFAIVCLATGCFEEGLFRFLLPRAFEGGFAANGCDARSAARAATLLSTLLFAFLHLGLETLPTSPLEGASMALKFAQGVLFGLAMARLVRFPNGLVAASLVHACYDLVFFAPSVWCQGWLPVSYLTGDPLGVAALAAASAILVPAVIAGRRGSEGL